MSDSEKREAAIRAALLALLDAVDYTPGACGLSEPIGAVLPSILIENARKALRT